MATDKYPIRFVLGLDDNATAGILAAGKKIRASVGGMVGVGQSMAKAGAIMTAGITAPIAGLATVATKSAMDFHASMANIATIVDTSKESIDDMGRSVLAISKRTPVAIEDLTAALYDVRSAGVSAADQFKVLETSAQLGVAGLGTTKQANDLLTSSLNAFGISASNAGQAANAIFTTVKSGKTTIEGLAQGFGAVAPTVAAAGVELDDYLSNVAAMTAVGTPAATVHTQLKAVISGLTRETAKSKKVFGALGAQNLPDLIAKSGGLQNALARISTELGGDSARILELVGSTEALTAILALTGTQAGASNAALADMRSGADNLGAAFAKQGATTAAAMQRSKNALEASAISIGERLLPTVERMAAAVAKATEWWDGLGTEAQNSILIVTGLLAVAGPFMTAVGLASTVIGGLATAWTSVTAAIAIYQAATGATFLASIWAIASAWFGVAAGVIAATWPFLAIAAAIGLAIAAWHKWSNREEPKKFKTRADFRAEQAAADQKGADTVAADLARSQKQLNAAGAVPVTGAAGAVSPGFDSAALAAQLKSETGIKIDFSGLPDGASVSTSSAGPGQVQTNVGRAGSSL